MIRRGRAPNQRHQAGDADETPAHGGGFDDYGEYDDGSYYDGPYADYDLFEYAY